MSTFETTAFLVVSGEKAELNLRAHYTWHNRRPPFREFGQLVSPEEPAHAEIHKVELETGYSASVPRQVLYSEITLTHEALDALAKEIADNH